MTPEKIIEIAKPYDSWNSGFTDKEYYGFTTEDLIAFAQAIIKAERESSDEPVAFAVFDGEGNWDLIQYLGNEIFEEEFLKRNPDPMYRDWVKPLYEYPPRARKLTDQEITEIMLDHGFKIKDGCDGLKPYVFQAVRAIERRINGEEE